MSKCATILPKCAQKSATALHKIILTPSSIFIAFLCFNFFQMSNFSVKKIKFTSKQFLNFVPKSYYSVPITLKNAPLWNFLRHQCLKCAHMSTIALTIRHTVYNVYFTVFMIKSLELPYFRLKVMLFNFLWHELTRLILVLKKSLSKFRNISFK